MNRDWEIHDWRPLPPLLEEVRETAIAELHRRLSEHGHGSIRPGHGCVFRFIDREGSRLTELAERSRHSKQAVGEIVADLEELGYVERIADPADGRAKIIRLTDQGWEAEQAAMEIFADIERRWAEEVGEERMTALRETLETIVELERSAVPA